MASYYDVQDLMTAVLFNDKKKRVSNISPTLLRNYPFARRVVKKSMVKEQGGKDIRFDVNVAGNTSARGFGAFHTVVRGVGDSLQQGTMRLRNIRADFSFDVLEEVFNQGEYQIINHIDNREQNAMIALTQLIETGGWGFVAAPGTEDEVPQGFLYWLPYTSTDGFTGTYPTAVPAYTTVGGLNPSTYSGWKSYGATWAAVTEGDLILKLRNAFSKTNFEPPLDTMIVGDYNTGNQYGIYLGLDTLLAMEDLARTQNDNVGLDLDPMSGRAMFRRTPLTEVSTLTATTRATILGVNWGDFHNNVLTGWWMKRMRVAQNASQPLTVSIDLYCVYQLTCFNRRTAGFNVSKAS